MIPDIPLFSIDGVWLPVRAELDGEAAPALALEKMELVIKTGTYAISFGGEIHDGGTVSRIENTLTLTSRSGSNAGRIVPAIYQIAGNRMRICFGMDGIEPKDFSTAPESNRYLVTYRRRDT